LALLINSHIFGKSPNCWIKKSSRIQHLIFRFIGIYWFLRCDSVVHPSWNCQMTPKYSFKRPSLRGIRCWVILMNSYLFLHIEQSRLNIFIPHFRCNRFIITQLRLIGLMGIKVGILLIKLLQMRKIFREYFWFADHTLIVIIINLDIRRRLNHDARLFNLRSCGTWFFW
jgi:hypothetical protein